MDPIVAIVNKILGVSAIISHVVLVLGFVYYLIKSKDKDDKFLNFLGRHGIKFAFFFALLAMVASLFYSNYAGFDPCFLCWFQRIFMYPLVFILLMAWIKKDTKIVSYVCMLAIIGLIIAAYHNYTYFGGVSLISCDASGLGESCNRRYVHEFGYITIPSLAFTSFVLVLTFAKLQKRFNKLKEGQTDIK